MPAGPAVVARSIVEQMQLRAITIGMVPEDRPGSMGVVGLPLWMWVRVFCLGHGRTVERPL